MTFLVNLVFHRVDSFEGPIFGRAYIQEFKFEMLIGLHICWAYIRGEGLIYGGRINGILRYCWITIMDCKCFLPNCKSGYDSQIKDKKTTFYKFWEEWKNNIKEDGKWFMTTESFICSKYFEEGHFVHDTNDTKNRKKRKI